jgi:predicted TIM-barrel fold metal-dependent hydrolase
MTRTSEPLGRKRYWPIYQAAAEAGIPVAMHAFGYSGYAMTSSGAPSFYVEEVQEHATSCQALTASLLVEGVFERFPTLKVVLIECGFAWLPALGWRLDKHWKTLRDEVPHLKRAPSEYMREHIWVSTQPMEEPERPEDMLKTIEWIGPERIMFSTDYPHWDQDDPRYAFKVRLPDDWARLIYRENAQALYRLD